MTFDLLIGVASGVLCAAGTWALMDWWHERQWAESVEAFCQRNTLIEWPIEKSYPGAHFRIVGRPFDQERDS